VATIGSAAMLLWYDIVPEQVAEHDEWHTREHFPERVGIPGFLRAQRWVAQGSTSPRYLVTYEVRDIATLTSAPYRERLDNPSDWTRRMMPYFRGMTRGFCALTTSIGGVIGAEMLAIRYTPAPGLRDSLARWLAEDALAAIAQRRGFASAAVFAAAADPPMTAEQRLRGRDASVDSVILVSSYAPELLEALCREELSSGALESRGATAVVHGRYRLACRADAG